MSLSLKIPFMCISLYITVYHIFVCLHFYFYIQQIVQSTVANMSRLVVHATQKNSRIHLVRRGQAHPTEGTGHGFFLVVELHPHIQVTLQKEK